MGRRLMVGIRGHLHHIHHHARCFYAIDRRVPRCCHGMARLIFVPSRLADGRDVMCSVVILRNRRSAWPVLIGANRDEMLGRPWQAPARHWPDRPDVTAGLDELAGGSWLGINDHGVVAMVLNRKGSLVPASGKRSRGELVLEALDHADAASAADALAGLEGRSYRPFNLVVIDNRDGFLLIGDDRPALAVQPIPEGLSMVTHADLNDLTSARTGRYLPRFGAAPIPDPDAGDWSGWVNVLGDRRHDGAAGSRGAMNIVTDHGFGTGSSALLALPSAERPGTAPVFLFCAGRPDELRYAPIAGLRSMQGGLAQGTIV